METPSGQWTRNIPGINGALAAIQTSSGSTELQLPDLHGDIVATASLSETETKLHRLPESTEYGVPREGTPPRYSWLGAAERSTELPSGVIAMGVRSYVPQVGRFLQEDPVEGGSANAYAYTYGDPVNSADLSGEYTATVEEWAVNGSGRVAHEGVLAYEAEQAAIRAAEELAAREEAERQAAAISLQEEWAAEEIAANASLWAANEAWDAAQGQEGAPAAPYYVGGCSGSAACIASANHEWVCTLAGAVVGAGVGAITAGVTGILAGGAFTAGCELGASSNRNYIAGLPHQSSEGTNCINVFSISRRTGIRDHRSYECETYYA